MTAPKMIWAWEYQGQHGREGQWRGSAMSAITGSARYIRADAPELVALVELMRAFCDAAEEADEWDADDESAAPVSVGMCREAVAALAAWEALE